MIDPYRNPWEAHPFDKRLARASSVLGIIWPEIKLYIRQEDYQRVHDAVLNSLHNSGADVITDDERERYGLAPRGPEGWTKAELAAMEAAMLQAMLSPAPIVTMVYDPLRNHLKEDEKQ